MSRETFSHLSSRISEIFLQTVARAGRIGGDGDGEVDVLALAKRGERVEELLQRLVGAVVEDLVEIVDEEISIGDYVLTGGEIPACVLIDCVSRMINGGLSDSAAYEKESHFSGLLEHPQYTRPEEWHGRRVPEILLSGHHANIEKWKNDTGLELTKKLRPDILNNK